MRKSFLVLLIIALLTLLVTVAFAEEPVVLKDATHIIVVNDPLGDNTGDIDVKSMVMVFSNVTGDYTIYLKSQGTNKFIGDFRININLFNPDAGTTSPFRSYFSDNLNDYQLDSPQTHMILSGSHQNLKFWNAGDRVFTNNLADIGIPDISLFRSSVIERPFSFLTNEDFIAFEEIAQPAMVWPVRAANQ